MKTKLIVLLAFIAAPMMAAPTAVDFSPFTIMNSWTTRINAVMGAEPHLRPGMDCTGVVQLQFLDGAGAVLAEKTARISPTTTDFLEFTPAREATGRIVVRPQISWVLVPPGPCRGVVLGNSEVFTNDTGNTLFVTHGIVVVDGSQQ